MGQALYRKYRSRSLEEIVGQEHITETLARGIKSGRISHAYLFTGPRGVGKTSVARILAHTFNDVPYEQESNHLDIIEIDAASSGGVDEVRELREKVYIAPSRGKYKVYIIDEVHMMTTPAFNALLKTLEEPPAHVIFILATTEAHKLPATIISRTQRFTFKPIPPAKVAEHLKHIASSEKISITDEALKFIAEHGEGSFRDSISMLDQASNLRQKEVDRHDLEELFGIPSTDAIEGIVASLRQHNTAGVVDWLSTLQTDGYQAGMIARQLGKSLRMSLIENVAVLGKAQTFALLERLIDVPASFNPDQLLELVLLEATLETPSHHQAQSPEVTESPRNDGTRKPGGSVKKVVPQVSNAVSSVSKVVHEPDRTPLSQSQWQAVLDALKAQYNTLYGILKTAEPNFTSQKIELVFGHAFQQKRAHDKRNKQIFADVIQAVTGSSWTIDCLLAETTSSSKILLQDLTPAGSTASSEPTGDNIVLNTVSNIFGGAELLES